MIQFQVRELYRLTGSENQPERVIAGLWSRDVGTSEQLHPLAQMFLTAAEFDALDALTSADWQAVSGRLSQLAATLREDAHNETGSLSLYARQLLAILGEGTAGD